jgi:putative sigma-54 modulation protein
MNISVRGRHLAVSEALKAYAVRRLTFSLGSFGSLVSDADIRIADVNGPRGGVDKTSVIRIGLRPIGTLVARARHADAYSAIDRAAGRIRSVLVRSVQRRTRARRGNRRLAR